MPYSEKPPMLEREEFIDWKIFVHLHLTTMDDEMMFILSDGPIKINKERSKWTADDRRRNNLDNLYRCSIYKTLDRNTFAKIRECFTTKEVWEKIIQLHEGNERTKENKILVATQKFENIMMRSSETMKEFGDRFTSVVNELSLLGKKYDNKEIIIKALRSLPSAWDIKTMVMRESNSLGKMKLHDILEDLRAYEFEMKSRYEDEASASTATRVLVTSVEPAAPVHVKSAEQFSEDTMAMLAKKFEKFMKKNQPTNSYNYNYLNGNKSNVRCYNCDALGHYRSECQKPLRDNRKPNDQREEHQSNNQGKEIQKALIDDDDGSQWAHTDSDSDDEGINCLMENEEEIGEPSKTQIGELSEIQTGGPIELSFENEKLKETVQSLIEENERTKYAMDVWKRSRDVVSQMTSHLRPYNCKFGLGYDNRNPDKSKSSNR
ncbi:uncharacterized protein LOC124939006 [Impatiens glandulifera]|uniref:uncharacterized protein LOC124939006 n=1 Tax=Impatiens glandulifera TaxID=253017 RepID=UPI001FB09014|nr:uncharacterized protein LOC124939006 [Impatiens glandulifera]